MGLKKQKEMAELKVLIDSDGLECPMKYLDKNVVARHKIVEKVFKKVLKASNDLKTLKKELFLMSKAILNWLPVIMVRTGKVMLNCSISTRQRKSRCPSAVALRLMSD